MAASLPVGVQPEAPGAYYAAILRHAKHWVVCVAADGHAVKGGCGGIGLFSRALIGLPNQNDWP